MSGDEGKAPEGNEPITIRVRDQVSWLLAIRKDEESVFVFYYTMGIARKSWPKRRAEDPFEKFARWWQMLLFWYFDLIECRLFPFRSFFSYTEQTGEETFFKIKKTTKMSKVFQTYANRKGVQLSSLRFLLDGERIEPDQTPKMLELDDQDQIDCMLEQSGGW